MHAISQLGHSLKIGLPPTFFLSTMLMNKLIFGTQKQAHFDILQPNIVRLYFLYDVMSGSKIMPSIKTDKSLVVYRLW